MAKIRLKWRNGWAYALWQEGQRTRWKALKTSDRHNAAEKFATFKKEFNAGKVKPISDGIRQTWGAFVNEFLEYLPTSTEPSTQKLYTVAMQKASDCWGDSMLLPHLTARHLDKLMMDMTNAGLKKPTINKNYRHVKAAIKKAIEWGYIKTLIKFPKQLKETKEKRALPAAEVKRLIKKLDGHKDQEFADFVRLAAYTGMRSGEMLRLCIEDIDNPVKNSLRITAKQKNKTENYIPISRPARDILKRAMTRAEVSGRIKVFRWSCRTHMSHLFKELVRSCGMAMHRLHDMRHTFCTYSIMSGNDIETTRRLARHSSIQTTQGYTNLSTDFLEAASNKLSFEQPKKIRRVK